MIFKLAVLGAAKHYKRSLVALAAAVVACAVMVAMGTLLNGIMASFYDGLTGGAGHIRVEARAAADALNPFSLSTLLPDAAAALDAVWTAGGDDVIAAEPALTFGALLVQSADPDVEAEPKNLAMRGSGLRPDTVFAETVRAAIVNGAFLPGGEGVCLSERAAWLLDAKLGQGVIVLVQDVDGQPWYEELPITGLFDTDNTDFDENNFYIDHDRAATMLNVAGATRELRILVANRDAAPATAKKIVDALGGAAGPWLIQSWQDIFASVLTLFLFLQFLFGFIIALFAIVALTIIANTVLMSVLERLREFGTMRAMGLKAKSLRRLILTEGAIIGAIGSAIGLGVGIAAIFAMAGGGLDLGGIMESLGLDRYVQPRLSPPYVAFCAAASTAVSCVATALAARSVSRKTVAESLADAP